jgi:hypothetical protein
MYSIGCIHHKLNPKKKKKFTYILVFKMKQMLIKTHQKWIKILFKYKHETIGSSNEFVIK